MNSLERQIRQIKGFTRTIKGMNEKRILLNRRRLVCHLAGGEFLLRPLDDLNTFRKGVENSRRLKGEKIFRFVISL